jgi:hypothetical protein
VSAHESHSATGTSARSRYAELTADGRHRELLAVGGVGVSVFVVAALAVGWQIGLAVGFWGAGAVLIYQWRAERAASWADAERRMTRLLAPLTHHGHVVLEDRALPETRAHLDHLVIGPTGVIVVDSKNWQHKRVVTGARGRIHIGRVSGRTAVRTAVFESGLVHDALARELGWAVPVAAVLAVHGARLPNWRSPSVNGVPLVKAAKVRHWIQSRPAKLTGTEVAEIAEAAERIFAPYETLRSEAHQQHPPTTRPGITRIDPAE